MTCFYHRGNRTVLHKISDYLNGVTCFFRRSYRSFVSLRPVQNIEELAGRSIRCTRGGKDRGGYLFCSSVMLLSALYKLLAPSLQLANFTVLQPRNDPYLGRCEILCELWPISAPLCSWVPLVREVVPASGFVCHSAPSFDYLSDALLR